MVVGVVGVFEGDSLRVVRRGRNARVCLPRQPGRRNSSQGAGASQGDDAMQRGDLLRSSDEKTLCALDSDRLGMLWYMGEDAFALDVFSPVWQEGGRGPCTPTRKRPAANR